jgi:hypothetical protein
MTNPTLILAAGLTVLGCSEPLSPSAYSGAYALRTVNAVAVPATAPALPTGCTIGLQSAGLTMSDGVFSLDCRVSFGCPGMSSVIPTWSTIGGAIESTRGRLVLRAFDPMSGAPMDLALTLAGSDAVVTIPTGALMVAAPTTLVFGPRQRLGDMVPGVR